MGYGLCSGRSIYGVQEVVLRIGLTVKFRKCNYTLPSEICMYVNVHDNRKDLFMLGKLQRNLDLYFAGYLRTLYQLLTKREVGGSWRKLHNDELHSLFSSPDIVRVIKARRLRWAGYVARMGEGRGVYRVFIGKPEGKRPLGRPRRRCEDNIKMELREIGIDGAK